MSLTRLALRLSSIAAVKASPALAGTKVHDTGWSKFDRVGEGDYSPVIIISTEDVSVDEDVSRHENDRRVDLLFQIALATVDVGLPFDVVNQLHVFRVAAVLFRQFPQQLAA